MSKIENRTNSFRHFLGLLAASALMMGSLQAQLKTDFSAVSFDNDLEAFSYNSLPELANTMVENTSMFIRSSRAEKVVLVAGIVDAKTGEILYGSVSEPILANRGRKVIGIGKGPLRGVWEAFEDPLFGFEDPLFGFEDPLFGFEDPLFGFEDPLFGFEDPLFGFTGSTEAIDAIWGTNGTAFEPETSPAFIWGTNGVAAESPKAVLEAIWGVGGASYEDGTQLLILTSVSIDPDSKLPHSAAILPFRSSFGES